MNWQKMSRPVRVAVVWFYLLLPSLLCGNLRCYYSPILETELTFELIVTECPPNEICFKAAGRYSNYTALSARGCMLEESCSRQHSIILKGVVFTMSYGCCDWQYCNSCFVVKPLYVTVALIAVVACSL